jgi:hypothetical protein
VRESAVLDFGSCCTCAACGHAFRWAGAYLDMPPCPRCGWRPPLHELRRLQAIHDALHRKRPTDGRSLADDLADGRDKP